MYGYLEPLGKCEGRRGGCAVLYEACLVFSFMFACKPSKLRTLSVVGPGSNFHNTFWRISRKPTNNAGLGADILGRVLRLKD